MSIKNIGVDPDMMSGLQSTLNERLWAAYKRQDPTIFDQLNAFLKASPKIRAMLLEGREKDQILVDAKFIKNFEFRVTRTIEIGTHSTMDSLLKSLKETGQMWSVTADRMLRQPNFLMSEKRQVLDLVFVTGTSLGYKSGDKQHRDHPQLGKLYERAREVFGLELCPWEVGPQLQRQYGKTINNESSSRVIVASEPIPTSRIHCHLFTVGDMLGSRDCDLDVGVHPDSTYIFVRPRSK